MAKGEEKDREAVTLLSMRVAEVIGKAEFGDAFDALCVIVAEFIGMQRQNIRARMWEEFVARTTDHLRRQDTNGQA